MKRPSVRTIVEISAVVVAWSVTGVIWLRSGDQPASSPVTSPVASASTSIGPVVFGDGVYGIAANPADVTVPSTFGIIPPGTYQTVGVVGPKCHWRMYDLHQAYPALITGWGDNLSGTRPVAQLVDGQGFYAWHCGGWARISD